MGVQIMAHVGDEYVDVDSLPPEKKAEIFADVSKRFKAAIERELSKPKYINDRI